MSTDIPKLENINSLKMAIQNYNNIGELIARTSELSKSLSTDEILNFLLDFACKSEIKSNTSKALRIIGSLEKPPNFAYQDIVPFFVSKDSEIQRAAIRSFARSTSAIAENILIENINNIGQKWQRKYVITELLGISQSQKTLNAIIEIYENTRIPDLKDTCIDAIQLLSIRLDTSGQKMVNELLKRNKVTSIGQLKYKSYKRITISNWAKTIHDFVSKTIKKKSSRGLNFNTHYLLDLNESYWVIIRANYFYNPDNEIRGFTLYTNYFSKFVTSSKNRIIEAPRGGKDFKGQFEDLLNESSLKNEFITYMSNIKNLSDQSTEITFEEYCQLIPEGYQRPNLYIGHLEGYVNFLIKNDLQSKILQRIEQIKPEFMTIDSEQMEYLLTIKHDH